MNICFKTAKNDEKTVLINNLFIHSNYNPSKQAEVFVNNLDIPSFSKYIIITEPGIPYIVPFLRKKFPKIKIGVIRYIPDFSEYDQMFDFVFSKDELEISIMKQIRENDLFNISFIKWEPSSQALEEIDRQVWRTIKTILEHNKTLLITRQYFEKKWLINSFNFFTYLTKTVHLKKQIDLPVLLLASGPSLEEYFYTIKNNQKKFFILCLSSAILPCIAHGIIPDLCISTDGGYWAGQHLKKLTKFHIPLALSPESQCPKTIFHNIPVLPLNYMDGICSKLLSQQNLPYIMAKRNGTVSGTALELALSISSKNVYCFGLDLSTGKGFQHSKPNELEVNNSYKDNRITPVQTRIYPSELKNSSLEIYENWFKSFQTGNRFVYRCTSPKIKNKLGKIIDISLDDFEKTAEKLEQKQKDFFVENSFSCKKSELKNFLSRDFENSEVKKQLYPLDYLLFNHEKNNDILQRIETNHDKLKKKLGKIINE